MTDSEFGKDLGLVQQVVTVGRSVGAGRAFWATLAEDPHLFKQFVEMAEDSNVITALERAAVQGWIAELEQNPCPIEERESYYANSSHCDYNDSVKAYHERLRTIFQKARHNVSARSIAEYIELHFIFCYVYSAVYMAKRTAERLETRTWFHHPIWGLTVTFNEILEGDRRAVRGNFLSLESFRQDPFARRIAGEMTHYYGENHGGFTRISQTVAICKEAMDESRSELLLRLTA